MRLVLLPLRFPSDGWVVCVQNEADRQPLRWVAVSGRRWLHAITDSQAIGALEHLWESSPKDARRAAHGYVQHLLDTGWDLASAPLPVSVSSFEKCGSSRHLPALLAQAVSLLSDRLSVTGDDGERRACVVQLPGRPVQFVPSWLLAAGPAGDWPFSSFVTVSLSRRMVAATEAVCPVVVSLGLASDPSAVQHAELVAALATELSGVPGARQRAMRALQAADALSGSSLPSAS